MELHIDKNIPPPVSVPGKKEWQQIYYFDQLKEIGMSCFIPGKTKKKVRQAFHSWRYRNKGTPEHEWQFTFQERTEPVEKEQEPVMGVRVWRVAPLPKDMPSSRTLINSIKKS